VQTLPNPHYNADVGPVVGISVTVASPASEFGESVIRASSKTTAEPGMDGREDRHKAAAVVPRRQESEDVEFVRRSLEEVGEGLDDVENSRDDGAKSVRKDGIVADGVVAGELSGRVLSVRSLIRKRRGSNGSEHSGV
jgi:hypothetical protein